MQAITTKYIGPTNHRGSRIVAKCAAGSVTVIYDDALGLQENHSAVAKALCVKLNWTNTVWVGGSNTSNGYVWVQTHDYSPGFKL